MKHKFISYMGRDIDYAVNDLLEHRKRNELAYTVFNGVELFSDTVTLDHAYRSITGKTKEQIEKIKARNKEKYA